MIIDINNPVLGEDVFSAKWSFDYWAELRNDLEQRLLNLDKNLKKGLNHIDGINEFKLKYSDLLTNGYEYLALGINPKEVETIEILHDTSIGKSTSYLKDFRKSDKIYLIDDKSSWFMSPVGCCGGGVTSNDITILEVVKYKIVLYKKKCGIGENFILV
jgi:hypothetical protein